MYGGETFRSEKQKKLNIFLTSIVDFYTHVWFHEGMKFLILWIEKENHAYKTKQKVFFVYLKGCLASLKSILGTFSYIASFITTSSVRKREKQKH